MQQLRYLNEYFCDDCYIAWQDEWDCACDDECPECGTPFEPVRSVIIDYDSEDN